MEEREGLGLTGNVSALGWLELELKRPGLQLERARKAGRSGQRGAMASNKPGAEGRQGGRQRHPGEVPQARSRRGGQGGRLSGWQRLPANGVSQAPGGGAAAF